MRIEPMVERVLILGFVAAAVVTFALVVRALARRRAAAASGRPAPPVLWSRLSGQGPTVIYLYGPHCGSCAEQERALDELKAHGAAAVVRLDATREREVAGALGIATVPSTVIISTDRWVHAVNLGYRSRQALTVQLDGMGGNPVDHRVAMSSTRRP
ncbi:MAG: hypothetical protein GEU73_15185 [Chloroflexi bacterium]|nr:hypothetical protein [Chloroflexota bacterium]